MGRDALFRLNWVIGVIYLLHYFRIFFRRSRKHMRYRSLIPAVLLLAVLAPIARPAQEADTLKLSLPECIQKTLKNNLGLAAELLTPQIAEADLALAGEKFIPSLAFSYSRQDNISASYSFLDAAGTAVSTLRERLHLPA